jgi:hypothetical protein
MQNQDAPGVYDLKRSSEFSRRNGNKSDQLAILRAARFMSVPFKFNQCKRFRFECVCECEKKRETKEQTKSIAQHCAIALHL